MLFILMILLFNCIYTAHQEWNIVDWVRSVDLYSGTQYTDELSVLSSIFPLALLIFGHVLYAFVLNPTVMGMRF